MPRRSRSRQLSDLSPTMRLLIKAAERECPPGHAEALVDLSALALRKVPSRGLFEPGTRDEPEFFADIESVAKAHLAFGGARSAWNGALDKAHLSRDLRDDIETAALHLQGVSETAYFYAGLAFGLTFVSLYRSS